MYNIACLLHFTVETNIACKAIIVVLISCLIVSYSETPWTVAHQAPLSMGFSRQEYWSRLPLLSPGDFPTQESNWSHPI